MKEIVDRLAHYSLDNHIFLEEAVEVLEGALITEALSRTNGNQSAASKILGIHRNTLQRKMEQYEVKGRREKRKPMTRAAGKTAGRRAAS